MKTKNPMTIVNTQLARNLPTYISALSTGHRSSPRMQGIQDLSQHPGSVLIQPCIGLIQEHDVRIMEKSSSDRQPLLHASGICRDQVLLAILQTHLNQQVTNPGVQVLQSIHAPIEPEILH